MLKDNQFSESGSSGLRPPFDRKPELLAPAGNEESFYGAVKAGADAVYLAGSRFGARAYAENFTEEGLVRCIRYAHLFGRKVYLTVNTLCKENELEELGPYLAPYYEAGLDAVIVQDLGVLRYIRRHFPGFSIHASTQMTLCSGYGAALLKELGACRIVPARELSLQELTAIKEQVPIELETFIHGAMCYCYSGQCLFSSILGGRSGNRGRCAQPCRLPYRVGSEKKQTGECYPLSLKDMCTIEHIPALWAAGIDSFKIEGRMKKPEYAAGVTAVYRKYIDLYSDLLTKLSPEEAEKAFRVEKQDRELLASLYIRSEIQDGYYFRHNGRDMVTLQSPAYSGSSEALLADISERYLKSPLRLPVTLQAEFITGKPARVTLSHGALSAVAEGAVVEKAQSQPVTEETLRRQLGKLGDSSFSASELNIQVSGDAFYPLKQVNELRRRAAAGLEKLLEDSVPAGQSSGAAVQASPLSSEAERPFPLSEESSAPDRKPVFPPEESSLPGKAPGWVFSVYTLEQLAAVSDWERDKNAVLPARIYVNGDLFLEACEKTMAFCRELAGQSSLYIALPYILRKQDMDYLERLCRIAEDGCFQGFLIRSLDGLGRLKKSGLSLRSDVGLYCFNSAGAEELAALGCEGGCLPYELNSGEQKALWNASAACLPLEKIVYSRIPMMITANCVAKTTDACRKDNGRLVLIDRYRKKFPVRKNCHHCMNIIYNSVPFSLKNQLEKWKHAEKRIDFTLETAEETRAVLDSFLKGLPFPFQEYTTGHEKRGVE